MTVEIDEREGLPSGSATGRIVECPGSHQLSKIYNAPPVDPWADSGSRIANLIELIETSQEIPDEIDGLAVDPDELETAEFLVSKKAMVFAKICKDNGYDPDDFIVTHEERLWFEMDGEKIFSGKLDTRFVHKSIPVAIIIDDKSGWREQPPPALNYQLLSYGLVVTQHLYPNPMEIPIPADFKIHIATASRFWDHSATIDLAEIGKLRFKIGNTMKAALNTRPFELGIFPGEWCRYCPARLQCPALDRQLVTVEGDIGTGEGLQISKEEIKGKIAPLTTPQLEDLLLRCDSVEFIKKAAVNEAESRIKENPDRFKYYVFKASSPRKQGKNLANMLVSLKSKYGVTDEAFMGSLRSDALGISKSGKLVKHIAANSTMTQAEAFDDLLGYLKSIDCVKETEPTPKLTKV